VLDHATLGQSRWPLSGRLASRVASLRLTASEPGQEGGKPERFDHGIDGCVPHQGPSSLLFDPLRDGERVILTIWVPSAFIS
jgi:hypothetical protein